MLDIKLFRDNPELIKESEKKRFRETNNVDKVIEFDIKWRDSLQDLHALQAERNSLSKSFKDVAKKGKDAIEELKSKVAEVKDKITEIEPKINELLEKREFYRYKVGNILHESVPLAEDETGDETVRKGGNKPNFSFQPKSHVDLVEMIDGVNLEQAAKIAGSRFYYLKNDLVRLNIALIQFALDLFTKADYTLFQTPFFMKHEVMKEASELGDFEDTLYKIEGDDLYLIATSEQTLAALHRGETIDELTLPRKYCGLSTCFRREAGSHGRDTLGIFRVHQFEKIEQFIFCTPEQSWDIHEEIIKNAEEIYKQLGIPYRILNIASGELNDNGAKKYDLEGWFPGSDTFRELVSCTNCTDYQARKLKIKCGILGDKESYRTAHTLNSTAIATERTICCILENYQQEDGTVKVPSVLVPYMGGITTMGVPK